MSTLIDNQEYYSVKELAELANCSTSTVYNHLRKGNLSAADDTSGSRKRKVISADQIANFTALLQNSPAWQRAHKSAFNSAAAGKGAPTLSALSVDSSLSSDNQLQNSATDAPVLENVPAAQPPVNDNNKRKSFLAKIATIGALGAAGLTGAFTAACSLGQARENTADVDLSTHNLTVDSANAATAPEGTIFTTETAFSDPESSMTDTFYFPQGENQFAQPVPLSPNQPTPVAEDTVELTEGTVEVAATNPNNPTTIVTSSTQGATLSLKVDGKPEAQTNPESGAATQSTADSAEVIDGIVNLNHLEGQSWVDTESKYQYTIKKDGLILETAPDGAEKGLTFFDLPYGIQHSLNNISVRNAGIDLPAQTNPDNCCELVEISAPSAVNGNDIAATSAPESAERTAAASTPLADKLGYQYYYPNTKQHDTPHFAGKTPDGVQVFGGVNYTSFINTETHESEQTLQGNLITVAGQKTLSETGTVNGKLGIGLEDNGNPTLGNSHLRYIHSGDDTTKSFTVWHAMREAPISQTPGRNAFNELDTPLNDTTLSYAADMQSIGSAVGLTFDYTKSDSDSATTLSFSPFIGVDTVSDNDAFQKHTGHGKWGADIGIEKVWLLDSGDVASLSGGLRYINHDKNRVTGQETKTTKTVTQVEETVEESREISATLPIGQQPTPPNAENALRTQNGVPDEDRVNVDNTTDARTVIDPVTFEIDVFPATADGTHFFDTTILKDVISVDTEVVNKFAQDETHLWFAGHYFDKEFRGSSTSATYSAIVGYGNNVNGGPDNDGLYGVGTASFETPVNNKLSLIYGASVYGNTVYDGLNVGASGQAGLKYKFDERSGLYIGGRANTNGDLNGDARFSIAF